MYLFRNTARIRKALNSAPDSGAGSSVWVPSTSGSPTEGGVSGRVNHRQKAQTNAMPAGTKKQSRQCTGARTYPHSTRMNPAPSECEMFQMDILVAYSFGGNQWFISRAQGGKPIRWNQPLSIQTTPNVTTAEPSPNSTFITADAASPTTMNIRALQRSPKKPLANLDTPYSTPCRVRNRPRLDFEMPRSCSM